VGEVLSGKILFARGAGDREMFQLYPGDLLVGEKKIERYFAKFFRIEV
jgi:hypothetical protein